MLRPCARETGCRAAAKLSAPGLISLEPKLLDKVGSKAVLRKGPAGACRGKRRRIPLPCRAAPVPSGPYRKRHLLSHAVSRAQTAAHEAGGGSVSGGLPCVGRSRPA